MGRLGYGPSLQWAEFVMGRDVQLPYIFIEKCEKLLQCKSFSHFFNEKYWRILDINI